ncbi:hypothetical protein F4803DRAFT_576116 [Xylaria telfairii]|nr:hypothetical protein F4803DRAFT_576116 [Xylaria telfairii]
MAPGLALDIYHDIAKQIGKPTWLNLCLGNKTLHQALYPQLIRMDLSEAKGKKSLWNALENDNLAQLEKIYAATYLNFGTSIKNRPHEFNIWLKYVVGAGVYGGLRCLRFLLARAVEADVGFVPSVDVLSAAVEGHNLEAVELLLQYGAPLTRQNEGDEIGPLFRVRSVEMLQYLLARGANPREKFEGMNLLHWHCSQVSTSPLLIKALIEAGVLSHGPSQVPTPASLPSRHTAFRRDT